MLAKEGFIIAGEQKYSWKLNPEKLAELNAYKQLCAEAGTPKTYIRSHRKSNSNSLE